MARMPSDRDSAGSIRVTAWPAIASVPASGVSAPVMTLISVDLPAPFSPTSAWTSPAASVKVTRVSARTPANDFVMESASRRRDNGADDSRVRTGFGARATPKRVSRSQTEQPRKRRRTERLGVSFFCTGGGAPPPPRAFTDAAPRLRSASARHATPARLPRWGPRHGRRRLRFGERAASCVFEFRAFVFSCFRVLVVQGFCDSDPQLYREPEQQRKTPFVLRCSVSPFVNPLSP